MISRVTSLLRINLYTRKPLRECKCSRHLPARTDRLATAERGTHHGLNSRIPGESQRGEHARIESMLWRCRGISSQRGRRTGRLHAASD